ncbi:UNVERIFIED_CONTAM: hypothetical protein FKN15_012349 [Acipenser sinensis]
MRIAAGRGQQSPMIRLSVMAMTRRAALTAPSTLLAKKEEVIGEIFPFCDPNLFCHRFRPRKTRRERRAAKNEGWQWTDSERFQVGAVGEESGGEAAEPAQESGSAASAPDRPDPELEAM